MSNLSPPIDIDADEARRLAEQELAKAEYQEARPGIIERALDWLVERVNDFLDQLSGTIPGGVPGAIVLLAIIAAAIGIVAWRVGRVSRSRRAAAGPVTEQGIPASHYRAEAEAAAAAGHFSTAAKQRFRALVRAAEERYLINEAPGRTADEAARELADVFPDHRGDLLRAAGLFDDVRYGERPADRAQYEFLTGLDQATEAARPAGLSRVVGS